MNELVKRGMTEVAKAEGPVGTGVAKTAVKTSAVGAGLYLTAGLIPFITFPMLLMILFVAGGGYLFMKS